MNPVIEKLILQIAYVCLHITAQGKWNAHFAICAHVRVVDAYILSADCTYDAGCSRERALSRFTPYDLAPSPCTAAEDIGRDYEPALRALLSDLQAFLAPTAEEACA